MSGLLVRELAVTGVMIVLSIDAVARQLPVAVATGNTRGAAQAAALRAQGLEHGYNLDYPEALAAFREAIFADPEDSTNARLAAATIWMRLLFEQGAVTVDDYLGQARANIPRRKPSAEQVAAFRHHLDRATALAEQLMALDPAQLDYKGLTLEHDRLVERLGRISSPRRGEQLATRPTSC